MINPYKLRGKNFYQKVAVERVKILDKFKQFLTKKKFPCYLCKSLNKKKDFIKVNEKYKLVKCKKCELVSPNIDVLNIPNYTDKIYLDYSKNYHSISKKKNSKYREKLLNERFKYCIEQNFKNLNNIKVLEIGSGTGEFLKLLHKKKIDYKGLEVDPMQLDYAKKIRLNVNNNSIDDEKDNTFDIILMFDVLEHVVDPVKFMKTTYKKLKKKGILISYMPNINSMSFNLMGGKHNLVYPFEHLNFFNKKSINYLANKTNFKVKKIETYGLDMIDYFFYREFNDKRKYFNSILKEINLIQNHIDSIGEGNHYRLTLVK